MLYILLLFLSLFIYLFIYYRDVLIYNKQEKKRKLLFYNSY